MDKLRAVPFQIIEIENGVILKRGSVEVMIGGERASEVVQNVLDVVNQKGATKEEICGVFATPDRPAVAYLVDELSKRFLLVRSSDVVSETETQLDVFYWHFGQRVSEVTKRLNSKHFVIMGVNQISRRLANSLNETGIDNIQVVDWPAVRCVTDSNKTEWDGFPNEPLDFEIWEKSLQHQTLDCLIATSEFGGLQLMRRWNEFCVESNCIFMSIILKDLMGYIGPIVIPHETACFECFLARRNANLEEPEIKNLADNISSDGQSVTGYHPIMASILGDIAAMELIKFYAGLVPMFNVGRLIKMNMLACKLDSHKVLKIPRCRVCSPLNKYSSVNLEKSPSFDLRT